MITEAVVRQRALELRQCSGHVVVLIVVDLRSWWEDGTMIAGLPVSVWDGQFPEFVNDFLLISCPVQEPGIACVELGME